MWHLMWNLRDRLNLGHVNGFYISLFMHFLVLGFLILMSRIGPIVCVASRAGSAQGPGMKVRLRGGRPASKKGGALQKSSGVVKQSKAGVPREKVERAAPAKPKLVPKMAAPKIGKPVVQKKVQQAVKKVKTVPSKTVVEAPVKKPVPPKQQALKPPQPKETAPPVKVPEKLARVPVATPVKTLVQQQTPPREVLAEPAMLELAVGAEGVPPGGVVPGVAAAAEVSLYECIAARWKPPRVAYVPKKCIIQIVVGAGKLQGVPKIVQSSGNALFDMEARKALLSSEYPRSVWNRTIIIHFS